MIAVGRLRPERHSTRQWPLHYSILPFKYHLVVVCNWHAPANEVALLHGILRTLAFAA